MYTKIFGTTTTVGMRGTAHVRGSDYVYHVQQGTPSGLIRRIRVTPLERVAQGSSSITTTPQPTLINLDVGNPDLEWLILNGTPTLRGKFNTRLYKYPSAPSGGLAKVDPNSLPALTYSAATATFAENGQGDNYYAAQTSSSNYAVFRIYKDSASNQTKIDWLTYKLNSNPDIIGYGYPDPRDIALEEDLSFVYVTGVDSANGNGYVYRVANTPGAAEIPNFTIYEPSSFAINPTPLVEPQQMALHNGQVYVVDDSALWVIDPSNASQRQVVSGLSGGTGLLIDEIEGNAYVTDQSGQIFVVDLTSTSPTLVALPPALSPLPGPTGFLMWADETRTAFLVPILDPDNKVLRVDLASQQVSTLLSPAPANPWSLEILSDCRLFLASDQELGDIDLCLTGAALLLGIGLVPFSFINQTASSPADIGKADTTKAPGYFYQVKNVPFGGSLNLMINHKQAWNSGLRYYRVTLRHTATNASRVITNPFTDLKWVVLAAKPQFYPVPTSVSGASPLPPAPANAFPVRDPNDLWYNPFLGAILHTALTDNGLNEIKVEFFDQSGTLQPAQTQSYVVLIDNNRCYATLKLPRIGATLPAAYPTPDCGCIPYNSKNDKVAIDFTAWQLQGYGVYTFSVYRGGVYLPALTETGTVDTTAVPHTRSTTNLPASPTLKVGHLLGNCNVASIMIDVYVPPRVIDGYRWLSTDARARQTFSLVPDTTPMSSPWVDPGG